MRKFALSILIAFAVQSLSLAWAWSGKVVSVHDGDTLTVLRDGREQVKVRLYGIDAPETRQDFGTRAKQALSDMAFGIVVEVEPVTQDRYGRTVAHILVDGQDVSAALVQDGMAWVYRRYCKEPACASWVEWEQDAKLNKTGLWSAPSPIPPWKWRRGSK